MKESFPLPLTSEVVESVIEYLSGSEETPKIPSLSPFKVSIKAAKEVEESTALITEETPFPSTETIVQTATEIIEKYQEKSLATLLKKLHIPVPNFKRLFICEYNENKIGTDVADATWYGLTGDLRLTRYQYSPTSNKLIISPKASIWRLRELIAALKLQGERISAGYNEDQLSSQVEIIAAGFNLTQQEALEMINKLTNQEMIQEYTVKQPYSPGQKVEKARAY